MAIYAQINNDGFLEAVSQLREETEMDNLIPITQDEYNTLFERFYKPKYENEEWVEGATPEEIETIENPPKEPNPIDQLEEENALIALELMETKNELNQLQKENADLVLMLVEKGVI